ncbi:hypothetical protein Tco_1299056 [Tanacetum coccineum]
MVKTGQTRTRGMEEHKRSQEIKPKSKRSKLQSTMGQLREKVVISKALIGSPKQGGHVEEGKHKRKLGFALESLTMKAQELHNGLPRWQSVYVVPTGRVIVPTSRYIVLASKVIIIVSPGRVKQRLMLIED